MPYIVLFMGKFSSNYNRFWPREWLRPKFELEQSLCCLDIIISIINNNCTGQICVIKKMVKALFYVFGKILAID